MEFSHNLASEPRKVIEVSVPKNSRPLWQKFAFFVVLIAIVGTVIFAISALLRQKDSQAPAKQSQKSEQKNATESAKTKSERCSPKQDFDNTKQGYLACFEAGWKLKELKVSGLEIGLAAADISGDFPGTINIAITDKSEDLVTQDASNNSSKFEFGKVNVDGKKSTQLVITRRGSDSLITYPRAIITATTKNNRTYVFTLNSTDAAFETDTKLYEDFLSSVEFSAVDNPPWVDSRNIIVNQPWPDEAIVSPVTIAGEAISFEAVVNIRIKDGDGKTLTETTVKTSLGTERSPFSGSITFDKPKTSSGTIEVFTESAKDGSDQDKVIIPIKFQ